MRRMRTPLQEDERRALACEQVAIVRVVSALREYRELVQTAIDDEGLLDVEFLVEERNAIEGCDVDE